MKAGARASNPSHISETSSSPAAQIIAASGLRWNIFLLYTWDQVVCDK